jgi:hypothetical protein
LYNVMYSLLFFPILYKSRLKASVLRLSKRPATILSSIAVVVLGLML